MFLENLPMTRGQYAGWIVILAGSLALTHVSHAATFTAGSSEYLETKNATQLEEKLAAENREIFPVADAKDTVTDPTGDVVDRWGQAATTLISWVDITDANVTKNTSTNHWDVHISTAAPIPNTLSGKAQVLIFIDHDGYQTNNVKEGFRSNADREYSLQYNADNGWYTDYRWWNPDPVNFWAIDQETASVFHLNGAELIYSIPFAELPENAEFRWRANVAVTYGTSTNVDIAPGEGLPPSQSGATSQSDTAWMQHAWVIAAILTIIAGALLAIKRRTRR